MSNSLLNRTYNLLDNATKGDHRLTQRAIAEGAGVSYWWFIKFAQRSIPDPGVERVQKVHDFLEAQRAERVA